MVNVPLHPSLGYSLIFGTLLMPLVYFVGFEEKKTLWKVCARSEH